MNIDPQQFSQDGFLILRNVVPADQLGPLRQAIEHMVEGRRQLSTQRRLPNEPAGGAWAASGQPRLSFAQDCDGDSALAIEFFLGDTTLGVCRQLIEAEEVVPHNLACICSADSRDSGPASWHRDIGPADPAPLRGMIANMAHHGPSYLQWNIALYEDSVLWVVPGSHRRVNSEEEKIQLAEDPSAPLPGGIPVELGPGDGVVYTHLLLHWGSNYSRKLRRTLHPGFRPFGFAALPNVHWRHWEPGFFHHLSAEARGQFETWDGLFLDELNHFAAVFRAVIARRSDDFGAALERLHPSPHARMVSLVMLARLADKLYRLKHTDTPPASLWGTGRDFSYLGSLFTTEQTETLRQRFGALETRLRLPEATDHPSFQRSHSLYEPNDMPAHFTVEDFIDSWSKT